MADTNAAAPAAAPTPASPAAAAPTQATVARGQIPTNEVSDSDFAAAFGETLANASVPNRDDSFDAPPADELQRMLTGEGEVESAPDAPAAEEAAEEAPAEKLYKVKIDGQEMEVTEQDLVVGFQLRAASNKKFQEAAGLRDQAVAALNMMKADPFGAMQELGLDVRQLAENYLLEQLHYEKLPPEQRELIEARRELDGLRKQQERARAEAEQASVQEAAIQQAQAIQAEFVQALQSVPELPKTPEVVKRMAQLALSADARGVPYTAIDLARAVKRELDARTDQYLKSLKPEQLEQALSPEQLRAWRSQQAERARSAQPKRNLPKGEQQPDPAPRGRKSAYIGPKELRAHINRAIGRDD